MSRIVPGVRPWMLVAAIATVSLAPTAARAASSVTLDTVAVGYDRPVLVTQPRSDTRELFIVEQTGKIKRAIFRDGTWTKAGTFLDLTGKVLDPNTHHPEQGLLGLAFHPGYGRNGLLYVNYTRRGRGDRRGDTVIAEYRRANARSADPTSRRIVAVIDQPAENHNGGHVVFGPDGLMYIGMGDGEWPGDPNELAQDLGSPLGKLLRIDPGDPDDAGPRAYRIPGRNPYVGKPGLDEIWASGLRNPWRFSFDRRNGDLWIGDVGEAKREEIDRARSNRSGREAGRATDFGWDDCEGSQEFEADEGDADEECEHDVGPVYEYAHGFNRCAVTGGYVHRGPSATAWHGLYVAGDYCGRLFVLGRDGTVRYSSNTGKPISSFGEDARGRIFAVDLAGNVYRLRFHGPRP